MPPSKRKRTESNDGSPDEVCASSQASPPPIIRVPLDRKVKKRARKTIAVESQQVGEITTPQGALSISFQDIGSGPSSGSANLNITQSTFSEYPLVSDIWLETDI